MLIHASAASSVCTIFTCPRVGFLDCANDLSRCGRVLTRYGRNFCLMGSSSLCLCRLASGSLLRGAAARFLCGDGGVQLSGVGGLGSGVCATRTCASPSCGSVELGRFCVLSTRGGVLCPGKCCPRHARMEFGAVFSFGFTCTRRM